MLTAATVCLALFSVAQTTTYPNTLLWRISGNGLQQPSYLFGTMHLSDRRLFHFSDSLYHYLEKAEGYAMEVDADAMTTALMQALSAPDTTGYLRDAMDKKDFKKIAGDLEKKFGVPAEKVTKKQAWLYKQGWKHTTTAKPDDMDSPVDTYLYNIARRQGKWVGGIEDLEDQLDLMNEWGDNFDASDLLLRQKGASQIEKMIKVYLAQDINTIYRWTTTMDTTGRYQMLTKRNLKMAFRIDSMAHVRSHFFAVGAAHLPGSDGLIELLKAKGFRVEPVLSAKKIAPEKYQYTAVERPWHEVQNEEKTYTASMPGKATAFVPGGQMKMQVYADMGTGLMYFVSHVSLPAGNPKDSFLTRFASSFSPSEAPVKTAKVSFKGMEGLEIYREENGYHYRMRLLPSGNQVVMVMVGSQKKSLLTHADAEKFFQLLEVHPTAAAAAAPYTFTDVEKAIALTFPGKPNVNEQLQHTMQQQEGADGWNFYNQAYADALGQVYYMLIVKETTPGYYITSDQELFETVRTNIENKDEIEITRYDTGRYHGLAAMWMDGRYKNNQLLMKSMHVNRGHRNFSLMVLHEAGADTTGLAAFFGSFRLLPYQPAEWKTYTDSTRTFTTLAPAPFIKQEQDNTSAVNGTIHMAYDKGSGTALQVNVEGFSPYYWTQNDSTFFAERLAEYSTAEDTVFYTRKITNGAASGMEYGIGMGQERRNYKKLRMLLHNDSLYVLSVIAPETYATGKDVEPFFTAFRFTHHQAQHSFFKNKTSQLLADLQAGDSAVFEQAKSSLGNVPFTRADLPRLHPALLEPYRDFDENNFCAHDALLNKIVSLADASTITFIRQHYTVLKGEKAALQYPLLRALASIPTDTAYGVLKELLLHHTPTAGTPAGLAQTLKDSVLLARSLYPELLTLSADSLFADVLVSVSDHLLDSGLLQIKDLLPYKNNFLSGAQKRLQELKASGEEASWSFYYWIYLLGKINDAESNQLLQQMAKVKDLEVKKEVLSILLKNGQKIDPLLVEQLAASNYYRLGLYKELKEAGKLSLFPSKYHTQRSLAQSEMFIYAADDMEPSHVIFAGERLALYKGQKKKFYLFKVQYDYEDGNETYLGITGPYDSNSKALVLESEAMGFAEELLDTKNMDAQFKAYLKQLEE